MNYEPRVNRTLHPALAICFVSALATLLTACGTPAAKDFGGRWKPVNRYDDKTVEIPLAVPYTYYAAPMDGTLKTMLTRWTSDTGTKLQYKLRSDFTLPKATAQIHTSEVRDAATQLSTIFAPQGVSVVVNGPEILVEETSAIVPTTPVTKTVEATQARANEASSATPNKPPLAQAPATTTPAVAADSTPRTQ